MTFKEIPALIRTSEWWTGKLPFQLGFIFYLLYASTTFLSLQELLPILLAWFGAFFAIAGLGYFINDYFDQTEDQRAGKTNRVAKLSQKARVFWMLFLGIANILPWLYLGLSPTLTYLLSAQFIAFLLYSVPPIRLKRVPYLGMLLDALYAYLIPSLITLAVFSPLLNVFFNTVTKYAFSVWILLVGFRNIVIHHLADAENDRHNAKFVFNWTQEQTAAQIEQFFQRFFLPLESLSFLVMFYFLPKTNWILIGLWVVFLIVLQILKKQHLYFFTTLYKQPPITRFNVFYESWLSLVLLGLCLPFHWSSFIILMIYLFLFQRKQRDHLIPDLLQQPYNYLRHKLIYNIRDYVFIHPYNYLRYTLFAKMYAKLRNLLYYIFVLFPIKILEKTIPKLYLKLRTRYRRRKENNSTH